MLQSTQNAMLRRIAGPKRRPDESCVEWIKRATRVARDRAKRAGIRFWLEAHLRAKWSWAGHVARMDQHRLAQRGLVWRDSDWYAYGVLSRPAGGVLRRPQSKRWLRWEDDLRTFATSLGWSSWQAQAKSRVWAEHCNAFVAANRK